MTESPETDVILLNKPDVDSLQKAFLAIVPLEAWSKGQDVTPVPTELTQAERENLLTKADNIRVDHSGNSVPKPYATRSRVLQDLRSSVEMLKGRDLASKTTKEVFNKTFLFDVYDFLRHVNRELPSLPLGKEWTRVDKNALMLLRTSATKLSVKQSMAWRGTYKMASKGTLLSNKANAGNCEVSKLRLDLVQKLAELSGKTDSGKKSERELLWIAIAVLAVEFSARSTDNSEEEDASSDTE